MNEVPFEISDDEEMRDSQRPESPSYSPESPSYSPLSPIPPPPPSPHQEDQVDVLIITTI
ncbi:CLUMA_CG004764, isoform A [Clunio marinus]|uniref:CLUMA_CG004764, isoform A n=1 Tax=Clunio marinus TaxID=568069 RepID=A0A1J1HUN2_9DIPT|nr:CLUMA_CG004764, isoform A [Clunio marinus]